MWDYKSLSARLIALEFAGVRRAAYGDCEDPKFHEVEDQGRFLGGVAIEARRSTPSPPTSLKH